MINRFNSRNDGVTDRLLTNSDQLEITAEKCDENFFVRFKLIGGMSFDPEENEDGAAMQFVRDLLDSFERSS